MKSHINKFAFSFGVVAVLIAALVAGQISTFSTFAANPVAPTEAPSAPVAAAVPAAKPTVRINLTLDQLSVVQQCINAAVKVGGLSDAKIILPVWEAIEEQVLFIPTLPSASLAKRLRHCAAYSFKITSA